MGIPLRHDRRFMPEQPLHLVQIHSGLDHPSRAGMPKIMEMEIRHLGFLQREMQTSADVVGVVQNNCFWALFSNT